jgi:hypothetical protein
MLKHRAPNTVWAIWWCIVVFMAFNMMRSSEFAHVNEFDRFISGAVRSLPIIILYGLLSYVFVVLLNIMSIQTRRDKQRRGLCMWCGYPHAAPGVCIECGREQVIDTGRVFRQNVRVDLTIATVAMILIVGASELLVGIDERVAMRAAHEAFASGSQKYIRKRAFPNAGYALVYFPDGRVMVIEASW